MFHNITKYFLLVTTGILLFGIVIGTNNILGNTAHAQEINAGWSEPINLSNSGSTTNPNMVVDSNGVVHVIWIDKFAGDVYSQYDGNRWSEPAPVNFPFSNYEPILLAGSNGLVHAFWTDESDILYYSQVDTTAFGTSNAWAPTRSLAESALDVGVAIDNQNDIHLSYVRKLDSQNFPAGVYYRKSIDNGLNWTQGIPIYQSLYFRSLTQDESNVNIATFQQNDSVNMYVVWDNQPLKRVFFAYSSDGGENWSAAQEIDQPNKNNSFSTPFQIQVSADGSNLLLLWKVGDPFAISCSSYYKYSSDGGITWSEQQQFMRDISGCPEHKYLFHPSEGLTILFSSMQTQIYLLAWDGNRWSDTRPQTELSGFEDPETFINIGFDCRKPGLDKQGNLLVVGCDASGDGDIWFMSRELGGPETWFPPPPLWSSPEIVTNIQLSQASPVEAVDQAGNVHLFWCQIDSNSTSGNNNKAIFYSRWDGQEWTNPIAVLHSPNADAANPEVSLDTNGDLVLVWTAGQLGPLYFSRVAAERAGSVSEWLEPIEVAPQEILSSSHDMYVDPSGKIYLAFVIPFNEDRGVYLTESENDGRSWSSPQQIFSGADAEWQRVGNVHIAHTGEKNLNVLWEQATLSETDKAIGLYFARSDDGGETWSKSEEVLEAIIDWSNIFTTGEHSLLRIWEENYSNSKEIKYQLSNNDGLSWENPESVMILSEETNETIVIGDRSGRVHMFTISNPVQDTLILHQIDWDGQQWGKEDDHQIDQNLLGGVQTLTAAISQTGRIGLIYTGLLSTQSRDDLLGSMFFITRDITLPDPLPTQPLETPTATITPTPFELLTAVPTVEVTLPADETVSDGPIPSLPMGISIDGLIIGVGIAGVLAVVVFGYSIFIKLNGRR